MINRPGEGVEGGKLGNGVGEGEGVLVNGVDEGVLGDDGEAGAEGVMVEGVLGTGVGVAVGAVGSHLMLTSSQCLQLWLPTPLLPQSARRASVPAQLTLSSQISPVPGTRSEVSVMTVPPWNPSWRQHTLGVGEHIP